MAHAYIPGLRVAKCAVLRKERRLPLPGEVLSKIGDAVNAEDIIARTHLPGNVKSVNVANKLGVHQDDVPSCMKKKIGDPVEANEVIASTRAFFGLFNPKVTSPIQGTIESISHITGQVLIREMPVPVEMKAYLDGIVAEILPNEGVVVETTGAFIQGIFGIGGESNGVIKMLAKSPDEVLEAGLIDASCQDKIIVGGSLVTSDALKKAVQMGAKGIVVGGINDKDVRGFLGYDIGVAITGSEQVGITLIVTEGFGKITMAKRTFDLLAYHDGKKASINGATQIRAGVIRPEVIVPLPIGTKMEEEGIHSGTGVESGNIVRIIREPNFGKLAEVISLPPQLETVESETKVRIMEARLVETGQIIRLPRANVEMIET